MDIGLWEPLGCACVAAFASAVSKASPQSERSLRHAAADSLNDFGVERWKQSGVWWQGD